MDKHRSEKLDRMLGKYVVIIFFDHTHVIGVLEWDNEFSRYRVGNMIFRKSHVKSIVERE